MNEFIKFKWFHTTKISWITDYISKDDTRPCVISKLPQTDEKDEREKYSFVIAREMSEDIQTVLEKTMNDIRKQENDSLPEIKIINLGLNCDNDFVRGTFELALKNDEWDNTCFKTFLA